MLLWATYSQEVTGSESYCHSKYSLSSLEGSRQGTLGCWLTDVISALLCRVESRVGSSLSWPGLAPVAAAFPSLWRQCSCTGDFQDRGGKAPRTTFLDSCWITHPSPAAHFIKYSDCEGRNKAQHTEQAPWEKQGVSEIPRSREHWMTKPTACKMLNSPWLLSLASLKTEE